MEQIVDTACLIVKDKKEQMETDNKTPSAISPTLVTSADQLLSIVREPHTFVIGVGQVISDDPSALRKMSFRLRALTDEEWAEFWKIGADIKPPQKFKDKEKKVPDGYDENDEKFLKLREANAELRRTFAMKLALVDLAIPGDNLDKQNEWRLKNLPPQVSNALFAGIASLTSDAVPLAHFFTGAA